MFTCEAIYTITEHLLENPKLKVLDLSANKIAFKGRGGKDRVRVVGQVPFERKLPARESHSGFQQDWTFRRKNDCTGGVSEQDSETFGHDPQRHR